MAGIWLPSDDNYLIKYLPHEPKVDGAATFQLRKYKAALPYIKSRRHAVDIGAHCGIWSRVIARNFARLTAFEPLPLNHECFALNMENAPAGCVVELHKCALGAELGIVKMQMKSTGTCFSYIDPAGNIDVPVKTLDSFGLTDVDFIKIDVEGHELFVLQGGEETIRRDRPFIIVEQKANNGPRYGIDWKAAVHLLKSWGAEEVFNVGDDHGMMWPTKNG